MCNVNPQPWRKALTVQVLQEQAETLEVVFCNDFGTDRGSSEWAVERIRLAPVVPFAPRLPAKKNPVLPKKNNLSVPVESPAQIDMIFGA